jgi:hypothetical protein
VKLRAWQAWGPSTATQLSSLPRSNVAKGRFSTCTAPNPGGIPSGDNLVFCRSEFEQAYGEAGIFGNWPVPSLLFRKIFAGMPGLGEKIAVR